MENGQIAGVLILFLNGTFKGYIGTGMIAWAKERIFRLRVGVKVRIVLQLTVQLKQVFRKPKHGDVAALYFRIRGFDYALLIRRVRALPWPIPKSPAANRNGQPPQSDCKFVAFCEDC